MLDKTKNTLTVKLEVAENVVKTFKEEGTEALILSRLKHNTITGDHNSEIDNFSTLHSLACKVLPKDAMSKLDGYTMWEHVQDAILKTFPEYINLGNKELKQVTTEYYYAIRQDKSNQSNKSLSLLEAGETVRNNYTSINTSWDWEDSLEVATIYLQLDNSLRKPLDFSEFIIIGMDLLQQPRNKKALDFLNAFILWGLRNGKKWNFWTVNPEHSNLLSEYHVYFDET